MPEQFDRERGHQFDTEAESRGLTELRRQIDAHQRHDSRQSYLSQAVGLLWRDDSRSLRQLQALEREAAGVSQVKPSGRAAEAPGESKLSKELTERIEEAINLDRQALGRSDTIKQYATGALKSAALFFPGRIGLAGTIATHGLDQTRHSDGLSTQFLDGALGSAKGGLLRAAFHHFGSAEIGIAARGVSLGVSSRILDTALSRQSYSDSSGNFKLSTLVERMDTQAINRSALFSDVVTFAASHALFTKLDSASAGRLKGSRFFSTVLSSSTFGFSSGAAAEIIRQQSDSETFCPLKVLKSAALQGGLDTLAAIPGGLRARSLSLPAASDSHQSANRTVRISHELDAGFKRSLTAEPLDSNRRFEIVSGPDGQRSKAGTNTWLDEGGRLVLPRFADLPRTAATAGESSALRTPLQPVHKTPIDSTNMHPPQKDAGIEILNTALDFIPLSRKLKKYSVLPEWFQCPDPAAVGPFESYADFSKSGIILHCRPTRVYDIDGHKTKLLLPEDYALELDAVRRLRHNAADLRNQFNERIYDQGREAGRERWLEAEKRLADHPLKDHPVPEDFVAMLERLPDSTLVKQIVVRNESDPHKLYNQQVYGKNFEAAATASQEGVITFYQPRRGHFLAETIAHEWSHLIDFAMPETHYLFKTAAEIERNGHYARHYGRFNDAENYAVQLGEELLNPEPARFTTAAMSAPLRTTVLMLHGLDPVLKMIPENQRSPYHQQFSDRVEWVRKHVLPAAEEQLLVNIAGASPPSRRASAELLIALSESPGRWLDQIGRIRALPELDLMRAQIGDEHTEQLSKLNQLESLRKLSLARNEVGDKTLEAVSKLTNLQELDLAFTKVTDAGLERLQSLEKLATLNLQFTSVGDAGVAHLAKLPGLYDLSLPNYGAVTDLSAQHLSALTRLQSLKIGGKGITDGGLAHLAKLQNLIELRLNYSKITDYGLIHLLELNQLYKLSLRGTGLTDEGLRLLSEKSGMHTLDLSATKVTNNGLAALKTMKYLAVLELEGNDISNPGIQNLSGLEALGRLNLRDTKITDDALKSVNSHHPNLQELDLSSTWITGSGLRHLTAHAGLKSLNLSCNQYLSNHFLAPLGKMPALQELNLSFGPVGDAAVASLAQQYNLRKLNLPSTKITDAAVASLKEMHWLAELNLNHCKLSYKAVADLRLALPDVRITFDRP
jgi:Leucine-rich repeat (LRR) protein